MRSSSAGFIGGVIGGFIKLVLDQITYSAGISTVDTVGMYSKMLFGSTQANFLMWIIYLVATGLVGWLVSRLIPVGNLDSYVVSGIIVGAVLWALMNTIYAATGLAIPTWSMGAGSFIINLITHIILGISITYAMMRYKEKVAA